MHVDLVEVEAAAGSAAAEDSVVVADSESVEGSVDSQAVDLVEVAAAAGSAAAEDSVVVANSEPVEGSVDFQAAGSVEEKSVGSAARKPVGFEAGALADFVVRTRVAFGQVA